MNQLSETLFTKIWWLWSPSDGQWFSLIYHWFNITEGLAWIVFAALVLWRYLRHRNSSVEIAYSVAFLAFAATDFREAWEQSSWLIGLKLLNLITLFWLRRTVMRRWYPEAKIYCRSLDKQGERQKRTFQQLYVGRVSRPVLIRRKSGPDGS